MVRSTWGQYSSLSPSSADLSHTTNINPFENKRWEIYFYKEVCSFVHWSSYIMFDYVSTYICICICLRLYNNSFNCTWLNAVKNRDVTFNMNHLFAHGLSKNSIRTINGTLADTITQGQNGSGINGNEGPHIPQISRIGFSLVSYPENSLCLKCKRFVHCSIISNYYLSIYLSIISRTINSYGKFADTNPGIKKKTALSKKVATL